MRYTRVNQPAHSPGLRSPDSVELFLTGPPARPHVGAGIFEAEGGSTRKMLREMRRLAALKGCDGLVIHAPGSKAHSDDSLWLLTRRSSSSTTMAAVCVVYGEAAPPPPPPPPGSMRPGSPCEAMPDMPGAFRCTNGLVCREGVCVEK